METAAEEEDSTGPDSSLVGANAVVGTNLTAQDKWGNWCSARVVGVRGEGDARELRVHFKGWNSRFDEWVCVGGGKLRESADASAAAAARPGVAVGGRTADGRRATGAGMQVRSQPIDPLLIP